MSKTQIHHAAAQLERLGQPVPACLPLWRVLSKRWRPPLLALVLAGCGGAEVLLIPLFEFGFTGKTGATTISLFLGPDKPTTSTGNFTLANLNVDDGRSQIQYTGSYSACSFMLSTSPAPAAPAAASYNGSFQGNDTVELRPSSGSGLPTLTLKRLFTGTVQTGC